ncbi:hypothetical protein OT109_03970 [Phycisphaeraceae bacterium D3-23]
MASTPDPKPNASRVRAGGMAMIVLVTLVSLGVCALLVLLIATEVFGRHALTGTDYAMGVAYCAVFVTAGASIALVFKLLVGKAGS